VDSTDKKLINIPESCHPFPETALIVSIIEDENLAAGQNLLPIY